MHINVLNYDQFCENWRHNIHDLRKVVN